MTRQGETTGFVLVPSEPTEAMLLAAQGGSARTVDDDEDALIVWKAMLAASPEQPASEPIDMLLFCPKCHLQHVDEPDERTADWSNPPHRSHLCHGCGTIWRPADVPTNGVREIATKGKADTWSVLAEQPASEAVGSNLRPALDKALTFICMFMAFDGRDRGTNRMDRTLDGLCKLAKEAHDVVRAALAERSTLVDGDGLALVQAHFRAEETRHRDAAENCAATLAWREKNGKFLEGNPDTETQMARHRWDENKCRAFAEICEGAIESVATDEEEAYDIGKEEGFSDAVQRIDLLTGGDGEYFASTIPGRGCPDAATMIERIVDRFQALAHPAESAVAADYRERAATFAFEQRDDDKPAGWNHACDHIANAFRYEANPFGRNASLPAESANCPVGMKPWAGGDSSPEDWDGGPVMYRNGIIAGVAVPQRWLKGFHESADDIIAYTPKANCPVGGEALREAAIVELRMYAGELPVGSYRSKRLDEIADLLEALPPAGAGEPWCPTCGNSSPDGLDCLICARWWAANPPAGTGDVGYALGVEDAYAAVQGADPIFDTRSAMKSAALDAIRALSAGKDAQ